jgi:glycosyltransferase involved in cell wall biosynthesis
MTPVRPLRIGYVSGSLDPGGAERQMLVLAQNLPRDRFSVEFVLLTHRGVLAAEAEAAGATIRVLGWTPRTARLHALRWLADGVRLGRFLRAGHYDVVDAWLFHAYGLAALTKPLSRVPVLISGRVRLSDYKAHFGSAEKLLDALAQRRADAIVANSEAVRSDVAQRERIDLTRIRVIRNGIEIPPPLAASERNTIRAGWGFGPGDVVIGSVANYKLRKGLESLLRVAARLQAELPQLRWVLVGEGSLRPTLEAMIAESGLAGIICLHGREPDARRLYGAFDIFAHASESEGMPNVILEAAAAGLPIVATPAGGTPEAVIDGETGLLVPIGDEDALASGLHRLVLDSALSKRLGAAGRKRVAAVFGVDRFVAETAALYEELAERKGIRR